MELTAVKCGGEGGELQLSFLDKNDAPMDRFG
jgi:hypothetical protein